MRVRTVERRGAASLRPAAGNVDLLPNYNNICATSRANLLEQAADVLCALAFFPLGEMERPGFAALFERRLRRAYGGQC